MKLVRQTHRRIHEAGGVPPVLQAASLKPRDVGELPHFGAGRSACIAGGLIEASAGSSAPSSPGARRSACIAGGLIEATTAGRTYLMARAGVPPVLQAASLKQIAERADGAFRRGVPPVLQAASLKLRCRTIIMTFPITAFRLYCRRPH